MQSFQVFVKNVPVFWKVLLFSFVFSIPLTWGKRIILEQSYVVGVLVDYLIPSLTLTDLLALGVILFSRCVRSEGNSRLEHRAFLVPFILLGCILFPIGALFSPVAAYLWWVRIMVCVYLARILWVHPRAVGQTFQYAIPVLSLFQSSVALAQSLLQHSLIGYGLFGESSFSSSLPTSAVTSFFGTFVVRAYGTTPHPNLLGGILCFCVLILWFARAHTHGWMRWIYGMSLIWGGLGLLVTLSRSALLAFVLAMALYSVRVKASYLILLVSVCGFGIVAFARNDSGFLTGLPVYERLRALSDGWEIVQEHPITGVGLRQSIVHQAQFAGNGDRLWAQPVHSVFMIILIETGVVGVMGIGLLMGLLYRKVKPLSLIGRVLLVAWVVLGFLDHYLVYLPHGVYLSVCIGVLALNKRVQERVFGILAV